MDNQPFEDRLRSSQARYATMLGGFLWCKRTPPAPRQHYQRLIAYQHVLEDRDPRRSQPLIDWVKSLPLEFHGDSAFDSERIPRVG